MSFISINTNVDSLNAGRFYSQNIANLSKSNKMLVSGRVDSDASDAPAAAAVGANLTSSIMAQTQASNNVTQASALISLAAGSLSTMTQILQTMKARSTQANSDTISSAQRSMLDTEYQALLSQVDKTASIQWNGTALFSGSSSPTPNRFSDLGAAKSLNTTDTGNTSFDATADSVTLSGYVAGNVTDVKVVSGIEGESVASIKVGNQTFVGTIDYGTSEDKYASQVSMTFTSTSNPANKITLMSAESGVDLSDTNKIQKQLDAAFGISQGASISLRSDSTALTAITATSAGAATKAGVFGMSYGYSELTKDVTYTLTDGNTNWTKSYIASDELTADRTVVFDNGLSITIAAGTNEKDQASGIEMLQVVEGNGIDMSFQVGELSTNVISFKFLAANTTTFNLSNSSISSKENSIKASDAIDRAIVQLGSMIAELGGTQSQLGFTSQGLALQLQNEEAARATFTDADITQALISSQQATALVNMSSTILQNTLAQPKKLAQLVESVLR